MNPRDALRFTKTQVDPSAREQWISESRSFATEIQARSLQHRIFPASAISSRRVRDSFRSYASKSVRTKREFRLGGYNGTFQEQPNVELTFSEGVRNEVIFKRLNSLSSICFRLLLQQGHSDESAKRLISDLREEEEETLYSDALLSESYAAQNPEWPDEYMYYAYQDDYDRWTLQAQFRALSRIACAGTPVGSWPLLLTDLMRPLESDLALICLSTPEVIGNHPDVSAPMSVSLDALKEVRDRLGEANLSVEKKYAAYIAVGAPDVEKRGLEWLKNELKKIHDAFIKAEQEKARIERIQHEIMVQQAQEMARAAADALRERIERADRIEGAENHVDQFDLNRERIERTC